MTARLRSTKLVGTPTASVYGLGHGKTASRCVAVAAGPSLRRAWSPSRHDALPQTIRA